MSDDDDDDFFADLLEDAPKPKPKPRAFSIETKDQRPLAVVCIIQNLKCSCGKSYETPTDQLYYRTAHGLQKPEVFLDYYTALRFETKTINRDIPFCSECLSTKILSRKLLNLKG